MPLLTLYPNPAEAPPASASFARCTLRFQDAAGSHHCLSVDLLLELDLDPELLGTAEPSLGGAAD